MTLRCHQAREELRKRQKSCFRAALLDPSPFSATPNLSCSPRGGEAGLLPGFGQSLRARSAHRES